jgi:hypothetical protein
MRNSLRSNNASRLLRHTLCFSASQDGIYDYRGGIAHRCFNLPLSVVEHCRDRAEIARGLFEGLQSRPKFRSARSVPKRAETPQANTQGRDFFWLLFFTRVKKSHVP